MSKSITNPKDFMSCSLTSSLKASTLNLSAKKNIASQMREKAAAAYRKQDLSSSMAVVSEQYCHSRDDYDLMATTFDPLATTHDPMAATIKRAGFIRHDPMEVTLKPAGPVPVRLSIRSPMDTYEISEREDSDTDDDDDSDSSNDKQKKKVSFSEFMT